MKKKWYKKWKIMVPVVLVILVIVSTLLSTTYTATKTYTVPAVEAVPAQEAIYSEPFSFTTNARPEPVLKCGEELPIGQELFVEVLSDGNTLIMEYQNLGAGEFEGQDLSNGQSFVCKEGKQVRIYNDDADVKFSGEKEVITPAVPAVEAQEAYDVTETIEITNDVETCTSNDEKTDCDKLKYYDELKDEAMKE